MWQRSAGDRRPYADQRPFSDAPARPPRPQLEGLLQVEDVGGAMLDELGTMSEKGPEYGHFIVWSEGARQQTEGMKLLQLLGVVVVGFPARHDFEGAH
jgi:hypothetical protein